MQEELRDLWFSSDYQVTPTGKVWSKPRPRKGSRGMLKGRWLKPFLKNGTLTYYFEGHGFVTAYKLVEKTFGDSVDPHIVETIRPSAQTQESSQHQSEDSLSDEQVDRIYRLKAANIKVNEIAEREGLDRKQVKEVLDEADEKLIEEYTDQWERSQQSVYPLQLDSWLRPSE
jgi:hypothetical protein